MPPFIMRNALPILFFIAALVFTSCGGSGDASSSLRIPCPGGQAFCVSECDLGCTGTAFSITEIAENQRIRFRFSEAVDPQSVNGASISIRTASGVAPAGDFQVSGSEVVFVPAVTTLNGVSSFGFQRNESYIITLAGGSSIAQSVKNLSGDGLSQEISGTVVASRGILDEDQQPPTVELVAPTNLVNAPVNPTIVLRFSELIDTTPLQVPLGQASPIRVVLRGQLPSGLCDSEAEGTALAGLPQLSTELVGQREVTVVTFTPSVQLPGKSCITVRVTADLRDLSGRSATPAKFVILTQEGASTPIEITESFQDASQQEPLVSGGVWGGGARPGVIGGDGRHGSFDPLLGVPIGGNVFEWNTDLFVIPQSSSLTGQEYTVTDGQFFFTDFVIPEGTTIRFSGSIPPVIRVRGDVEIAGSIDISGADLPFEIQTAGPATGLRASTFNARNATAVTPAMPGTAGGPGGGSGGNGGQEGNNAGPLAVHDGQPGQDVSVLAGHAYAASVTGTGGLGSTQTPATGVWPALPPLVGPGAGIYCAYFSPGGGGGGFSAPGMSADAPSHVTPQLYTLATTPIVAGGAAFNLLPFPPAGAPAGYTSLDHFMVGGSGGGGGGSHGYGLIAVNGVPLANERWIAGHAGSGGGGAAAIRCGGTMTIAATASLTSRGGEGVVISGDNPLNPAPTFDYGISSPGGGGSGGSFLLQAGKNLSFAGTVDTRGGEGSTVGFITNNIQAATGKGGDGADGFFRLESEGAVAFGGTSFPAFVQGDNSGPLTDRDSLSGDASLWYSTGLVFPPTWERYELDVDTNGDGVTDITFTDSGEPGTQKAFEVGGPVTLPLVIEFQGAELDQSGTTPIPGTVKPWREGIGSGSGPGIQLDSITVFRFRVTYNRGLFPDMVVQELRVYART